MKCVYCGGEIEPNKIKCDYCGKTQPYGLQNEVSPEMVYQYHQDVNTRVNKVVFYMLLLLVIGSLVGCFLPYAEDGREVVSYIYNEIPGRSGEIADGVLILISSGIALLFLLFKRRIPVLLFQSASLFVAIYDYFQVKDVGRKYLAAGFYTVLICLIASVVLSLIRLIGGKRKFK